ncbi:MULTISPECIES: EcsC family protein [unclassified Rathayibacter]|uniref:EcsC family protein n=1 Tax=unclassified Rathayibacter TaxID=2609250 RepID=UPI000F4C66FB|nr:MULTISPECIES: EcsC family protein [unclassified Rathayibacter]
MAHTDPDPVLIPPQMSAYDAETWKVLNAHWGRRANARGLPNWMSTAIERTGKVVGGVTARVTDALPDAISAPLQRVGDVIADRAAQPALHAAIGLLELYNAWARELNNPATVEKLARKHGLMVGGFTDLREHDLKDCDRLLRRNTLTWRTAGAIEGGSMGALALVPVVGIPVAIGADILVIQVLSTAIASRVAYSYGYDAKDPAEQAFIQRLVRRSFITQAAKAKPVRDATRAAQAIRGRVRWSEKLRHDHRLLAVLEKLMGQVAPSGTKVSVQAVAKAAPFVGILIGAGANSSVLGNIAADAQRYCQTRFLCEKYGLPLPSALLAEDDDDIDADTS